LRETEIKARVDDKTLESLQAFLGSECRKVRQERQADTYLQHPCRDFAETDEALRVRVVEDGSRVELCYKGPKGKVLEFKRREEVKVEVDSDSGIIELLKRLGFTPVATVVKSRTVFDCRDFEVSIDRVEGLGTFVEFELKSEGLEERLLGLLEELGLLNRIERKTYLELVLERKDSSY